MQVRILTDSVLEIVVFLMYFQILWFARTPTRNLIVGHDMDGNPRCNSILHGTQRKELLNLSLWFHKKSSRSYKKNIKNTAILNNIGSVKTLLCVQYQSFHTLQN